MSDYYEFALLFDLKPDVSQAVIDILEYMIQSQDDEVMEPLDLPSFFEPVSKSIQCSYEDLFPSEISQILRRLPRFFHDGYTELEEYFPGSFGRSFHDHRLVVRKMSHEDEFWNIWPWTAEWFASISSTDGIAGFYRNEHDPVENATLICFSKGKLLDRSLKNRQVIMNFLQAIDDALDTA